jgi:hypothetical protein
MPGDAGWCVFMILWPDPLLIFFSGPDCLNACPVELLSYF